MVPWLVLSWVSRWCRARASSLGTSLEWSVVWWWTWRHSVGYIPETPCPRVTPFAWGGNDTGIQTLDGEADGRVPWVAGIDSPREQSPSNNRSADCRGAQSPKPTVRQIVKLWVSIGLEAAPEDAEWFVHGSHFSGWPIRACQMWSHRRSPTSNHTPAAPERIVLLLCVPFVGLSHLARVQTASPICSALARNRLGLPGCRPWGPSRLLTWQHPPPAPCPQGSLGGDWPRFRPFQPLQVCSASDEGAWMARWCWRCCEDAGSRKPRRWPRPACVSFS